MPGAAPGVARVIAALHDAKSPDFIALGAGIRVLGNLEGAEAALKGEPSLSLVGLVERWWWSESVMGGLESLQSRVF